MNILRVIATMHPSYGGPCQGIRNSIPEFLSLGVNTEVLCFDASDEEYNVVDDFIVHKIGPSKNPYGYVSGLKLWMQQNAHRFDAIIIHGIWQYNSFGTYRVWRSLKRKKLLHSKLFVMPHGMLDPYFQKAPDRRLKAFRNFLFWHLFERRVINGVDGVLFTCERELELARETFSLYTPKKEINVGYGILKPPTFVKDMKSKFLNISGLKDNQPYFLFLSRIHEKKGVDLLIGAYKALKKNYPDLDIPKLVVAGPTDSFFAKRMIELASGDCDIIFSGMLQGDSKWGAIYGCELFVLPSHQENFGIAVVEALSCGKPVLITDKINIWKEIVDSKGGIVDSDNFSGIYNLLWKWCSLNESEKALFKDSSKSAFLKYFQSNNAAKKLLNAIK